MYYIYIIINILILMNNICMFLCISAPDSSNVKRGKESFDMFYDTLVITHIIRIEDLFGKHQTMKLIISIKHYYKKFVINQYI